MMVRIIKKWNCLSEQVLRPAVAGFFLLMFFLGLWATPDYGQHLDENNQFVLVHANMKEYILHLTEGDFQADLLKWYEDRGIAEISQSENLDHGVAVYYPIVPVLFMDQMSHELMLVLWNGYTFILFFSGVIALYFIGKKLFSTRAAGLAAALAFYLTPRMFAEGHYNNKDLILLCMALVSVWMGLCFVEKRQLRYALCMGAAAALSANIKIVGAWPFGLVGLWYLWELTRKKEWSMKHFGLGLGAVASFFAVYVLITPACWTDPAGYIAYLTGNAQHFARWDGEILFDGQLYRHSRNPLPRTYLIRMLGMTVPVYILILWAVGQIAVLIRQGKRFAGWLGCRIRKENGTESQILKEDVANQKTDLDMLWLLLSFWWMLPLIFAMTSRMLVYNSWRHFYFCYGAIVLLAVYGVKTLAEFLQQAVEPALCGIKEAALSLPVREMASGMVCGLFGLCLCFTAVQNIRNHPYEYTYFNILAGDAVEQTYEIDYWEVGGKAVLEELYAYLEETAPGELSPVLVSACDITTLIGRDNGWVNLPAAVRDILICTDDWQEADYIVINPSYSAIEELSGNEDSLYVKQNYTKIGQILAYGNEVWTIYAR